jgi:mannose-6-phosphate isomerase
MTTSIMTQQELFARLQAQLDQQNFNIVSRDENRPWGGFLVINEAEAAQFIKVYFPGVNPAELAGFAKLSPKILVVAPGKRLSWQYHHRRAELWRVVEGPVGVVKGQSDEPGEPQTFQPGDLIRLSAGERHRLMGLDGWGVVAEVWQHIDAERPSDESDIVRLQDDYGREQK